MIFMSGGDQIPVMMVWMAKKKVQDMASQIPRNATYIVSERKPGNFLSTICHETIFKLRDPGKLIDFPSQIVHGSTVRFEGEPCSG